jgi:o-succinylbenzoate synthase
MRIVELETIPYGLPFREPYATARGTLERREIVLLRLVTDSGHVGLGEAVPLALRGGDTLASVERGIRKLERRLRRTQLDELAGEDSFEAAVDAYVEVAAGRRLPHPAAAAVEMALLDLAGRVSGRPLWELLRAEQATPVTCNATLVAGPPESVAADAERWASDGFTSFKLKLGTGADLEQVSAVREAVGPQARIRIDANGTWSVEDAIAILGRLEPLDIELAEQPAAGLRELAAVRGRTSIPIAADESVASSKDAAKAAKAGACDLVTVKLVKVGGIGPSGGIARELPVYLSSALDGPVGIAAAAHAAQAMGRIRPDPGLAHGLATQRLFAATIATRECELRGDRLQPPPGSGLGVELDEEALDEHRL